MTARGERYTTAISFGPTWTQKRETLGLALQPQISKQTIPRGASLVIGYIIAIHPKWEVAFCGELEMRLGWHLCYSSLQSTSRRELVPTLKSFSPN
jgi:hypothetical protein